MLRQLLFFNAALRKIPERNLFEAGGKEIIHKISPFGRNDGPIKKERLKIINLLLPRLQDYQDYQDYQ